MIPELIPRDGTTDVCAVAGRWGLEPLVVDLISAAATRLGFSVSILSGMRSDREQNALRKSGRPTADNDRSTHLSCPATGVDLFPNIHVTNVVKARLGAEMVHAGLRWGGGSPVDPETGIPSDWPHFDLGPRRS